MNVSNVNNVAQSRYPQPVIALFNLSQSVESNLRAKGFNTLVGSFGTPYHAPFNEFNINLVNVDIPENFGEADIVVIDLSYDELAEMQSGHILRDTAGNAVKVPNPRSVIDPRPHVMYDKKDKFERIFVHGGVFIVFADLKTDASMRPVGVHDEIDHSTYRFTPINTWSFLPIFSYISWQVRTDVGNYIRMNNNSGKYTLGSMLERHLSTMEYKCTVDLQSDRWIPLMINKFSKPVGGVIVPVTDEDEQGLIIVLPQIKDKTLIIEQLLTEYLPSVVPALFPYHEGASWVKSPEYEIPEILLLKQKIQEIEREAAQKIASFEDEITLLRSKWEFVHRLITATGDDLKDAVKTTLEVMGFKRVLDKDKEEQEKGKNSGSKREDLQIQDILPWLLVEVKGIAGKGRESDILQVVKYIAPRMRELNRTTIRGLAIINHQRNIPLLDREENPFNAIILENAKEQAFGIFTTRNLHKLLVSFLKLNWKHEYISPLFYINGFVEPIPAHYQYVGEVEIYWRLHEVVGIRIKEDELFKGAVIAFELPLEFIEQTVESLQVEKQDVGIAGVNMLAGVKTKFSSDELRKGIRVYRVVKEEGSI